MTAQLLFPPIYSATTAAVAGFFSHNLVIQTNKQMINTIAYSGLYRAYLQGRLLPQWLT